jgi:hypothetical protein
MKVVWPKETDTLIKREGDTHFIQHHPTFLSTSVLEKLGKSLLVFTGSKWFY